ncbi:MAG: hypothetical protein B6245_21190 [Desulfobacteraceae bacterium 4572_88]|nr:MAG: hypothetical protein B6245_21190 [Desulfobacteraceae bacterium 4572_88]
MAKRKRVTRKQLLKEPDEFLTFSRRLLLFVLENKVKIATGLGAFFAVIIVFSGIQYFSDRAEDKAFALIGQGMDKYETLLKDDGPEKAYTDVQPDFQLILDKYSEKNAGKLARIIYANICYNAGNADKAIELYDKAIQEVENDASFKNLVLSGLAYAHEAKKDYKTAIRYFETIANGNDPLMKDEAFFNLGRLYAETGEGEKSMNAFKTIVSDYTDSLYLELAKERVAG